MGGAERPEQRGPTPDMTVVLCTYNRAERIAQTVKAVLAQEDCQFELVVVDDGSTDHTPEVLAAIDDARLRVVRRDNGGLSQARNSGLAAAEGRWTVFLDDDDQPEPGWLATLLAPTSDPSVGISCCGSVFVNTAGDELYPHPTRALGEVFGDVRGSWLAGTFAARTDLLRRAGGYLNGLGVRHQTELFLRLVPTVQAEGLRIATNDAPMVRIEGRPATQRPGVNPRRLYDGTRWILARHAEAFAGHGTTLARYESVIATAAARLGDWKAARRHYLRAARATPTSPKGWGRYVLAAVPAIGGRVWNRHGPFASHDISELGVLRQDPSRGDDVARELFLAWRYRENPPIRPEGADAADVGDTAEAANGPEAAQGAEGLSAPGAAERTDAVAVVPVGGSPSGPDRRSAARRLATRLARKHGWSPIVEIRLDGAASEPTASTEAPTSTQPTTSTEQQPGLTLCLDVVERADDPVLLLRDLAAMSAGRPVLLSTPDRAVADPERPLGPPSNPHHRREWTYDQFELLLLSTGFDIERSWHMPPGDPTTPVSAGPHKRRRTRSSMVFLIRARAA